MSQRTVNNNTVTVVGKIFMAVLSSVTRCTGRGFYNFKLMVQNQRLFGYTAGYRFRKADIWDGHYKLPAEHNNPGPISESYNKFVDGSNRLILTIFARDLSLQQEQEEIKTRTRLSWTGTCAKARFTGPRRFGREITDILLAVNRAYRKSDYIPCIAWGKNTRFRKSLGGGQDKNLGKEYRAGNTKKRPTTAKF